MSKMMILSSCYISLSCKQRGKGAWRKLSKDLLARSIRNLWILVAEHRHGGYLWRENEKLFKISGLWEYHGFRSYCRREIEKCRKRRGWSTFWGDLHHLVLLYICNYASAGWLQSLSSGWPALVNEWITGYGKKDSIIQERKSWSNGRIHNLKMLHGWTSRDSPPISSSPALTWGQRCFVRGRAC